jgi:phospholipid/cholesterol/gamma-HCH transport system substrate-binding protein
MDTEVEQRDRLSRALGKHPSLTIAAAALAGVVLFLVLAKPSKHLLQVVCYFKDAQGLRSGARVRLAGVEVGTVTGIRVRPELREHPAEVVMTLQTPYELKIPKDSIVTLQSAGVLGEVFPEIEIKDASGPPIESGGVLETRASERPTSQQLLDCFSKIAEHKPCDLDSKNPSPSPSSSPEHR